MSFHALASLIITLSSLLLGGFVYAKGRNKTANITLSLYTIAVAAWSFGQFMTETVSDYPSALFWARFHLAGAIFIPVFFIHFVDAFLGKNRRTLVNSAYLLGVLIFAVSFTPLFVSSVSAKLGFRYYPDPGPAFFAYSIMFAILVIYGLLQLAASFRANTGIFKNQIMYVLIASIVGFAGGSMMFLPVFNVQVYPIGYYLVPVYILIAIYAFMKHRLLDISIVIRRGLVYSVLTLAITVIYVLMVLFLKETFQIVTGQGPIISALFLILLLAIFLNPLRDKIQKYVDIVFFKNKYDYQKALKDLSFKIRDIMKLEDLIDIVMANVKGIVKVENASLYIIDRKSGKFVLQGVHNPANISNYDPIIKLLESEKRAVFAEDSAKAMRSLNAEIGFPMFAKNKMLGVLFLGKKLSGDMFSDDDIDLLSTLCNQMAGSIENSMLVGDMLEAQKQLYQADKLSTLGTLAAGLAHEIKNPIASIKGFAELIPKAVKEGDMETIEDFSSVVPRQLERVNGIVEKLLRLSKPTKPEVKEVEITALLDDIVKLMEKQCIKQGVRIIKEYQGRTIVMGDINQLTQALMNIMLNGVQAMENGGELRLKVQESRLLPARLAAERAGRHGKTVEISDTGKGIPADQLEHIFDPFYTTKEGGSGLGLAVTKKIISDHNGSIGVDSSPGKGTTFRIVFNM
jgi:signal transduction histidine kinase